MTCVVVLILATWFASGSVNQMLPSGPAAMALGSDIRRRDGELSDRDRQEATILEPLDHRGGPPGAPSRPARGSSLWSRPTVRFGGDHGRLDEFEMWRRCRPNRPTARGWGVEGVARPLASPPGECRGRSLRGQCQTVPITRHGSRKKSRSGVTAGRECFCNPGPLSL